jgi:hypothetical protein
VVDPPNENKISYGYRKRGFSFQQLSFSALTSDLRSAEGRIRRGELLISELALDNFMIQLVAIHILLVGNDTGNSPIPPNERESEFF